jgi:hypothetical protein
MEKMRCPEKDAAMLSLLAVAYLALALTAIGLTLREQRQTAGRSASLMAVGFLACAFWPVTTVLALISMYRQPS